MIAPVDNRSLEAQIAECYRDMYFTENSDVALTQWRRLRELRTRKTERDTALYLREASRIGQCAAAS